MSQPLLFSDLLAQPTPISRVVEQVMQAHRPTSISRPAALPMINTRPMMDTSVIAPRANPWTRIGKSFAPTPDASEALRRSGLDWSVEKVGLRTNDLDPVNGHVAIRRSDNNSVLGITGKDFELLQNAEAFAFFKELAGQAALSYETAGCFSKGAIVWVQARLPEEHDIRIGDDVSASYLFISNGHIGNKTLTISPSTIRIVCQNTLRMAEAQGAEARKRGHSLEAGYTVRHTKGMKEAIADIRDAYAKTLKAHVATGEAYRFLASKPLREKLKTTFFDRVFPAGLDESERAKSIAKARRDRLENILVSPTSTVKGTAGTAFSLFQSSIEYIDHDRTTRTSDGTDPIEQRMLSAVFGSGADLKAKAWETILELTGA